MTVSPPRKRRRISQSERVETTQRKIIDSALQLLRAEGFKNTTLQAVARGADVSLGALQHHFESRDALMERLVLEVMQPLSEQGSVWPDPTLPLPERAHDFVHRAWDNIFGVGHYQAAWSLFFGCKSSPSLFERIHYQRIHVDQAFYSRFLEAFPEIQTHHPHPAGCAAMIFATLRGAGILELFTTSEAEKQGCLQALIHTITQAGTPR